MAGAVGPGTVAYGFPLKAEFDGNTRRAAVIAGCWISSGSALNIALAMRDSSAGERTPGGSVAIPGRPGAVLVASGRAGDISDCSLVLMVLSYVYVFEQGNRIVHKYGRGTVK
jgi:hypothetical protein